MLKTAKMVSRDGVSRGSQVELIHKRLAAFEREQKNVTMKQNNNFVTNSIAAENLIKTDTDYQKVLQRRLLDQESQKPPQIKPEDHDLPLEAKPLSEDVMQADHPNSESDRFSEGRVGAGDRGYFVEGDEYVDDYVLGSTAQFPGDEIAMPSYERYGSEDAVEHIEFQLPGQSTQGEEQLPDDDFEPYDDQVMESTSTENLHRTAIEINDRKCSGCGAQMHCEDSSLPGFLPVEQLEKTTRRRAPEKILCRRCHLLKHHNFLLNVNVCEVDYVSIMSCLRLNEEALVLLVVDITDIPGSIHRQLPHIIGPRKPMIVIANKVDLLPPDARTGYLKRYKQVVEEAIEAAGFRNQFTILHTALVSAKTGYGVEDLITEIYLKYTSVKLDVRNDIYLVGCTNAGKSSLFNALLQSDLCKIRAVDLVERATTSVWPGTTLSLLKFPVMQPSPFRLELRRRRLLQHKAWLQKEMYNRKLLLQQSGDPRYAVLFGTIQNTFKEKDDELQPIAISHLTAEEGLAEKKRSGSWSLKDPIFEKGMWCYDTPGTINDQQVLNLFTLEELIHVLPRRLLQPRTALVPVGHSLIIAGVARLDVTECVGASSVLLTTFVSDDLPLNCMPTVEVDAFLKENVGTEALVVPKGKDRLLKWPDLQSREFELQGAEGDAGVADIVLSSIGWVLVSTASPLVRLRCFTPGAKGLATRTPLLPYAATLRGKRIPGTRFYKVKPVEFPVNVRRMQALKRQRKRSDERF
ncbi:hypothetical protein Y032_0315g2271 [Ancylostoma ceylanicum]|nr:hypothetical protein Y032_0315g2271 [Ancylostoma ceylanicum]